MKKCIAGFLCLFILAGCTSIPVPKIFESPAPVQEQARYAFTEKNYPRVDGSTATIPLIEAVESVLLGKPRSETAVTVSKTSGAYIALLQNEADVLLVYDGGEQTRSEVKADALFETVPIGKDALVFLVNADNPVDNLTTEQVRMIFSGQYTNWSELGGSDEPIRAYQRGAGAGSQALMDKLVMQDLPMADPAMVQVIEHMGGLIDAVANFVGGPTGIGYNVFFYVTEMRENDYVKLLSIDGVEPSYETIQSGEYPFVSEFYSVIRKSEPANSPARALHEWMLSEEAQNLMASENYVALYANPDAATPLADGAFSLYPEGEVPVYFEGVNPYVFAASRDYGKLYFYLGGMREENWSSPMFYGICNSEGKIITEPIFTAPRLLTGSEGNSAYFCYRADLLPTSEERISDGWEYEGTVNPALLFATDGSWVREFDGAEPCYGFAGAGDVMVNADILAVKLGSKWGAVNLRGETVIPFAQDGSEGIYGEANRDYSFLSLSANRLVKSNNETFDLYDADMNIIVSGLKGRPQAGSTDFIISTAMPGLNEGIIYLYTLDGICIAERKITGVDYIYAGYLGDYVCVYDDKGTSILDRQLNDVHEFPMEFSDRYGGLISLYFNGPNVLYKSDEETGFHRTYLPDGTRLVTWYDPEMNEFSMLSEQRLFEFDYLTSKTDLSG